MIPILTREQMRAYDARAIDVCGVPGLVLMENAGRGAAEIIAARAGAGPVAIVCGRGNNGGDGFVVARHLRARAIEVDVLVIGERDRVKGDARSNLDALLGLGVAATFVGDDLTPVARAVDRASLVVDALFGTGLDRALESPWAEVVAMLNARRCPLVALDIPSGIDANTGAVLGAAVRADVTITFGHRKAGLLQGAGLGHGGELSVVGLGIPDASILDEVGSLATAIAPAAVVAALGARAVDVHKYRAGSVLVIAGSAGKVGAALLAGTATLRSGAGLGCIASWPEAVDAMEGRVPELMTHRLDPQRLAVSLGEALDRRTAVAIGPGFGLDDRARSVVDEVVLRWKGPVVVDADALGCFAGRANDLASALGPRVITPHSGELGRLLGKTSADVEQDRFAAAREAADRTGAAVVLKGARTIVCSARGTSVSLHGDPVLATGGSGDVLTGMVAALLCHADPHAAACGAVHLHAMAAERWRAEHGSDRGLLASDLIEGIPTAIATIRGG
jgi:ADP-dependent NAD(P)H-hydrate dehydratase / NAD(P)H-hydrate epimerase